ncbi:MAG: lipoprotein-releasing ABC transporter permease subunit [Cellvibrionaceae bacterium]
MKLPISLFIGLRYTRAKRRNQFISFVSGFSLLGMALGTLSLIVVMSVMNGFDREIKQRLLQVVPHIEVYGEQTLSDWSQLRSELRQQPQVEEVAPYVQGDVMASFERGVQGVQMRGLNPADIKLMSSLDQHLLLGSVDDLRAGQYNIIIGRLLARYLGVGLGDKINVTLPQLAVTPMGIYPRVKRFTVVGVFEVGAQVDQQLSVVHLADAQRLFRLGQGVTGLELKTSDMYSVAPITAAIEKQFSTTRLDQTLKVSDWSQTQASLFSAVKMEKTVVSVLLMIIIAVAAFNIVSSLVLMVADKKFDIAVLRTLGLSRAQVMAVFVVQGSAIGALGVSVGGLAGSAIAQHVGSIVSGLESLTGLRVFDPNVYFISHMPSVLMATDVILVISVGLLMSVLSTLYPAYRASCVEPAEALRYE